MRVKQRVIVEKEFLKPQNISEEKWINHWKKNSDNWGNTESDFYDYHQETYASDVENLENTFKYCEKVKSQSRFRIRSNAQISQAEIKILHHYLKNDKKAKEVVIQNLGTPEKNIEIDFKSDSDILDIRNKMTSKFADAN